LTGSWGTWHSAAMGGKKGKGKGKPSPWSSKGEQNGHGVKRSGGGWSAGPPRKQQKIFPLPGRRAAAEDDGFAQEDVEVELEEEAHEEEAREDEVFNEEAAWEEKEEPVKPTPIGAAPIGGRALGGGRLTPAAKQMIRPVAKREGQAAPGARKALAPRAKVSARRPWEPAPEDLQPSEAALEDEEANGLLDDEDQLEADRPFMQPTAKASAKQLRPQRPKASNHQGPIVPGGNHAGKGSSATSPSGILPRGGKGRGGGIAPSSNGDVSRRPGHPPAAIPGSSVTQRTRGELLASLRQAAEKLKTAVDGDEEYGEDDNEDQDWTMEDAQGGDLEVEAEDEEEAPPARIAPSVAPSRAPGLDKQQPQAPVVRKMLMPKKPGVAAPKAKAAPGRASDASANSALGPGFDDSMICWDFTAGRCKKGNLCKWVHLDDAAAKAAAARTLAKMGKGFSGPGISESHGKLSRMFSESGLLSGKAGGKGPVTPMVEQEWSSRCKIEKVPDSEDVMLHASMATAALEDQGMLAWAWWFDKQLEALGTPIKPRALELDFSDNQIGAWGVAALCTLLEKHNVRCDVVRLDDNYLDDDALRDLSRYLMTAEKAPVLELSLERNCITSKGIAWLLSCVALHPAYPSYDEESGMFLPLKLHLKDTDTIDDEDLGGALIDLNTSCHMTVTAGEEEPAGLTTKCNCVAHLCGWNPPEGIILPAEAPSPRPYFGTDQDGEADPIFGPRSSPCVLFEDEQIAVIYKPAGWSCAGDWDRGSKQGGMALGVVDPKNPPPEEERAAKLRKLISQEGSACIKTWLYLTLGYDEACDAIRSTDAQHGLCHRLDNGTSGPVVIGKSLEGYEYATQQIRDRDIVKDYLALVHGRCKEPRGICRFPIDRSHYKESGRVRVHESGQPAVTIWETVAEYESPASGEKYTLVHYRLITGRTHQIRVHTAYMGHPIMSDWAYCTNRDMVRQDEQHCKRIFLHKFRVSYMDMEGFPVSVSCPLRMDPQLWGCLESLRLTGGLALTGCNAPGCSNKGRGGKGAKGAKGSKGPIGAGKAGPPLRGSVAPMVPPMKASVAPSIIPSRGTIAPSSSGPPGRRR